MPASHRVVSGHCGICPSGCDVRITLDGGRIARVTPDAKSPYGICCRRVGRSAEVIYSPDRLLHPLKRVGARGEDRFQRIDWEEALETIRVRLREIADAHGPQAVCLYTGRGTFERSLWEMLAPAGVRETCAWSLLFPFGSPNTTGAGSNCYVSHAVLAPATTFGVWWADTFADIDNAKLVVVWGTNPANASPPETMRQIEKAAERGAEVIVIDHRRTETAREVNALWLPVRPGTDGALALSMINVVIEEGLYDRSFAQRWTVGFEELRAYVAQFTPERAEEMTGVTGEEVRRTARRIAAGGAALLSYTGLEYTTSGVQNIRAIMTLWALTGNLDVPGGNVIKMQGTDLAVSQARRVAPPAGVEPIGKREYPLYHRYRKEAHAMELPKAILENDPYPVRGLLEFGASIITGYPNPSLWRRAFSALDFMLVVDRFPTEDSLYADIVLPAATSFEEDSYLIHGDRVQLRQKVIEPLGESRSDWAIVAAIADRLGYGHLYPRSAREMLQWAFVGTSVDLKELLRNPDGVRIPAPPMAYRKWESGLLRRDGAPGFDTPSGKFEIASSILADHGYDALPIYAPPREGPEGSPSLLSEYPLVFNSGARNRVFFCSQHHNIPALARQRPKPLVWMHSVDAQARDIATGDAVTVATPRGNVRFEAVVTDDIAPGAIEADANGGSSHAPAAWRDCNVNELTDSDNRDPLSGFPVYKALLCDVRKVTRRRR